MMPTVLHVPFTYFPEPCGGTEIYVQGLAQRMESRGWRSAVAAPGEKKARYNHAGLLVHRFGVDTHKRLDLAYCEPDESAAANFQSIVGEVSPAIVHLHAHTSAVSERLVDVAHRAGAKVAFTYHTPTASCARGTMMLFGAVPCDGEIEPSRCTACTLDATGVPRGIARLVASLSGAATGRLANLPFETVPLNMLRVPGLIARRGQRFANLTAKADAIVAVCHWVQQVLQQNGVPADKITLSRQGISSSAVRPSRPPRQETDSLRIAYFGRLDSAKGVDLLINALRRRPGADVRLDVYAVAQAGSEEQMQSLHCFAADDPRFKILPSVAPERVISMMGLYEFVAVPSRWLETGPLVVLEAFAAGVPVLGANLGGIAELVRDGVDGVLLPPDNIDAWADGIDRLAGDPEIARRLQRNISPPRTMDDVADDMSTLYASLVGSSS